jgi:ribosome maturation protein SDO1
LEKGELQVSEKEREQQNERILKDIATLVAEKCVDPTTQRPFTVSSIERAIKGLHYSIHPTRAAKQQVI